MRIDGPASEEVPFCFSQPPLLNPQGPGPEYDDVTYVYDDVTYEHHDVTYGS